MQDLLQLDVTPEESSAGSLTPGRLAQAQNALREDGIVVLAGVVSEPSVLALRAKALEDVERLLARDDSPFNWTKGNIQQDPAPYPPHLFRDVLVNDVVISVTRSILGNGLHCGYYSGNTALPSDARQPVHADEGQLWPDLEVASPPSLLVVNVPLVDMGPENGSTEVWPGTHLDTTITIQGGDIVLPEAQIEARRSVRPPFQPLVKAGSVVIRDIRMWHAGMPNRTSNPRPMIAMIHSIGWRPSARLGLGPGSEPFLEHPDLRWDYRIVEEEIDHIASVQGFMAPTG